MGVPAIEDFNCGDNEGASYFHVNQKRGRRWSAARGFLKPALRRATLRLEVNTHVERVIIKNGCARAVRFHRDGQVLEARATGEVILCAGAIGSPHLLSLSGIGRHEWLSSAGIPVQVDLPGVGSNLQDHLQQRAIYKVANVRTLNQSYRSLTERLWMGADYLFRRRGPLTMAPSQLGIFLRSSATQSRANVEFHVQPLSLDKFGDPLHSFPAITMSACNLRPTSRGRVQTRSADPLVPPLIAPNYLSTPEDRATAADILRVTRHLMSQTALQKFAPVEFLPGPTVGDDTDSLIKAAGDIGTTIFHPVGTARMGPSHDEHAVVDNRLRVRGVERLRVVDASVMPTITSGNTNTPTAMIAEQGAEMILQDARKQLSAVATAHPEPTY
jgi:choline dehydrogenase-like flavoprotein